MRPTHKRQNKRAPGSVYGVRCITARGSEQPMERMSSSNHDMPLSPPRYVGLPVCTVNIACLTRRTSASLVAQLLHSRPISKRTCVFHSAINDRSSHLFCATVSRDHDYVPFLNAVFMSIRLYQQ